MLERWVERFIFTSRWLLAPFCILLALALVGLFFKTLEHAYHYATHFAGQSESDVILNTLSLIDLTLTASLLVLVIFSVYENFVSRIDAGEHADWPEWMSSIDFTGLKLKLLSALVAISGVQLLRQFMNIGAVSDRDVTWSIAIHLTLVVSGLLMALTDRMAHGKHDG